MLSLYLKSIVLWTIIVYCSVILCEQSIVQNGWIKSISKTNFQKLINCIVISCVPLFRVLIFVWLFIFAVCTPEQLKEKGYEIHNKENK